MNLFFLISDIKFNQLLLVLIAVLCLFMFLVLINRSFNLGRIIYKGNIAEFEKINQVLHSEIFSLNTTLILNGSSQIVGSNARLQKMFGWEEKELINKGIDVIILPEYLEQFENYKKHQNNDEENLLRVEGVTKDSERLWLEIFVGKWTEGVSTYFTVILKSINHRIKNEQMQSVLREEVDSLRKLYHEGEKIGNVAFWHLDVITGTIVWCSPNFYHLLGIPRNSGIDIKIETIVKRICVEDRVRVTQIMSTAKENNTGYDMEYRLNGWDGYINTIHSVASAYKDWNGEISYYIGMARLIKKEKPAWL